MGKFEVPDKVLYVCTGSKCGKRGGKDTYKMASSFVKHNKSKVDIEVIRIECTDRCKFAPVCNMQPENIWLKEYSEKEVLRMLANLMQQQD